MRKAIAETIPFPGWAKNDVRYKALDEFDRYLDGEIYDHLEYPFYEEEVNGKYIRIKRRRPSVRFNLYAALADNIARNIFAGSNAPVLEHPKENVRKFFEAIKEETEIHTHMIELTNWATIGSSVATFKIVTFEDGTKAKAVIQTRRSKQCTPFFNEANELSKLRVHYVVSGDVLLTQEIGYDYKGNPIKFDQTYWFVRDFGSKEEVTFYPIPEHHWEPMDVVSPKLKVIENFRHSTGLNFVPALWMKRRTGKVRPYDGRCVWEHAIPNVIDFDYTMSTMGAGVRYNATPQVVIKGNVKNADEDGKFVGGPARYLHFEPDQKDPDGDGLTSSGSGADLLEATGNGMKVGIELYGKMLKEIAIISICGSQKDPNKVTTAMSAKGMEVLDREYNNLILEFRTVCGDNGYLKLLKRIGAACVEAKHPLAANISMQDLDGLTLNWPPLNPIGAQEFLNLCQGAAALLDSQESDPAAPGGDGEGSAPIPVEEKEPVMERGELRSYIMGSIDLVRRSSDRNYMITESGNSKPAEPSAVSEEEKKNLNKDDLLGYAESAVRASQRGEIDTSFKVGEG